MENERRKYLGIGNGIRERVDRSAETVQFGLNRLGGM